MIPDYADFLLKSGILAAERSLQTSYVCHLVFLKELVDGINDFASVLVCSGQVTDYNVQYQGSCHGPQTCREAQWGNLQHMQIAVLGVSQGDEGLIGLFDIGIDCPVVFYVF